MIARVMSSGGATCRNGKAETISLRNVPSFAARLDATIEVPGLGTLTVDAVLARDFPVIQGVILFFAFLYVMVNLLVDLSYLFLDPRIRY